jgi:triacylglycerol esterase/lipase EstA (alpha/beta hydrolase family)
MPFPRFLKRPRLVLPTALATLAVTTALASVLAAPAHAATTDLPVNYDFIAGAVTNTSPTIPPPGANNWSCQLTAAHPYPVILVHGTDANMDDNWQAASPVLANHGYCVYAFNYGGDTPTSLTQGTGEIGASAAQLATFVNQVLTATGAAKVDLVGHSQGGMMPRYYINFLGGASTVHDFVALAPDNYGTTLDGLTLLASEFGVSLDSTPETAGSEQIAGSAFLAHLNVNPTVPSVHYTDIESKDDEIVTPYTSSFLPAAPNVTNITVQDVCSQDESDHIEMGADPVAMALMLNALDPAAPVKVPCLLVLPLIGPLSAVPSF